MTREEVFEHVKGILVETLSVDEDKVTMDARFQEDLETDSLDLYLRFACRFPDEPLRGALLSLAEEEKGHLKRLAEMRERLEETPN